MFRPRATSFAALGFFVAGLAIPIPIPIPIPILYTWRRGDFEVTAT
ncbi:hypothetical protein H9Q13_05005 [Pontibacter sp. JH31]|uniref:Uncharacterized protein n=1 Tax=Pontibacter aquaedesilientis TaxID=2766980 RepID=A0ABR7XDZ2_9BACT|nr:hypothetical protein [Pontibacter aquaedesilientis]MBD1396515.1 hypothetical protein [Pontibacter aquaedesilientis]